MSPSASKTCSLALLGNPENRRIQDFSRTWQELSQSAPPVLAYLDFPRGLGEVELLRIDSPGENEEVARRLIRWGGGPASAALGYGEIGYLREYHRGFCALLEDIERRGIRCLNHPAEIRVMFDKWRCHQLFLAHGLPRPPSELAPCDFAEFVRGMPPHGRLFLKPLHGSSASGVCALRWTPRRRQLTAALKITGQTLTNSLRVQRYESWRDLEFILSRLLPQGMIAERWIPKLTLAGGAVDLRVLVIGGRARHRVLRVSDHPMTNLHLGNRRGESADLGNNLEPALRLAEEAAACFPRSLYAGVDVLLDARGRPLLGEINAFGDLLPGLEHQGQSAYAAISAHVIQSHSF